MKDYSLIKGIAMICLGLFGLTYLVVNNFNVIPESKAVTHVEAQKPEPMTVGDIQVKKFKDVEGGVVCYIIIHNNQTESISCLPIKDTLFNIQEQKQKEKPK